MLVSNLRTKANGRHRCRYTERPVNNLDTLHSRDRMVKTYQVVTDPFEITTVYNVYADDEENSHELTLDYTDATRHKWRSSLVIDLATVSITIAIHQ